MPSIFLIRHGQASFGLGDYDKLSETGLKQATLLGKYLSEKSLQVTHVVSGSLKRHQQTAENCLNELNFNGARLVQPNWNEFDHNEILQVYKPEYADFGAIAKEIVQKPNPKVAFQSIFSRAVERWVSGEFDSDYKESWAAFNNRVAEAFSQTISKADKGGVVLVFTSGGVISALAHQHIGMSVEKSMNLQWRMPNCAITRLAVGSSGTHLVTLNEYGFLEGKEGMVTFR